MDWPDGQAISMSNILKKGIDFLAEKLKAHASEIVVYKRGLDTITIQATSGKTNYQIEDESGFKIGGLVIDFLFAAQDLVINGTQTTPQAGDQIKINSAIYEVMFLPDGCWRYSDPYRTIIRLHTKEI